MTMHSTTNLPATPAAPRYSVPLRLWHWATAFVVTGLLTTILFIRVIINIFRFRLLLHSQEGLDPEQAHTIARMVSNRIWAWHNWLGLALAGLLLWRVWLLLGPARQAVRVQLRGAQTARLRYAYWVFYALVVVLVATGICAMYVKQVPLLGRWKIALLGVHTAAMYGLLAFLGLHLASVLWGEWHGDRNVTSAMLHGDADSSPAPVPVPTLPEPALARVA